VFARLPNVLSIEVPDVLSYEFSNEVIKSLADVPDHVSVIAFVGSSSEVFSLGMDLETFVRERRDPRATVTAIGNALVAIHRAPRPTLAVVRGRAVGGGVGLLAACDYVVADHGATFGLPEMLWGFVPAAIWPLITARIGAGRARAWAISAFARSAHEAHAAALVDEIAQGTELPALARRAVKNLARVGRGAIALLRDWSTQAPQLPIEEAVRRGAELSAAQFADPRVTERLASYFVDGVPPWETNDRG
jgi:methylglutaconyl-CoA hydratase